MAFKSFKAALIIRVVLLIGSIFLLTHLYYNDSYDLTKALVIGMIGYQVYALFHYLDKSNREIANFLSSIQYDDFSNTYTYRNTGGSIDLLYEQFNNVMKKFRDIRAEKEAQYTYYKTIVQHVGIGIITFDKHGEIQMLNTAAKNLLQIGQIKNISNLKSISQVLVDGFFMLKTGGRDLIKIERNGEEVQLAIYAIELTMRGEEFKLISLQNIKSELEEKEMEAWQNLIRVLTHEIMNSVTPISSLAGTVESELGHQLKNGDDVNRITNEEIQDLYLAVQTIHRRSDSLIKFVSDFRNLTRLTMPKLAQTKVRDLLDHVLMLLKYEIERGEIKLTYKVEPKNLEVLVDKEQIEQVLINLVKNAIQALEENDEMDKEKLLIISANGLENNSVSISITDNGPGIEEDALKKIFIPFFTTKKSGSGIGLSLSKQIMRQHKGSISVKSVINQGTEFVLRFS
ncbi:ATP-binding protein [Imperialibacter roseus]|uniref:histidine kinase n=1 Tax=Imperialibacter roseus TaxID=1324217 RepID=A0ABZ0ILZ4_9BACT|nr:ATP-binding protein [Imperialibacter roseus]WOK05561.1 ATP-binding protein [Imperialibacter roseus]|tara:strand:- start:938 stop:2308 length:1371 start_codon:yes stop_codon:yes gene_type:complete